MELHSFIETHPRTQLHHLNLRTIQRQSSVSVLTSNM